MSYEYFVSYLSSVSIATGYGLVGRGSIPGRGKRLVSTPQRPDRLWGPPSLLYNVYLGPFQGGLSGRGMKLTTHLRLTPRSRMVELYFHSPTRLHGVVLN
jgi:hypothetical protein